MQVKTITRSFLVMVLSLFTLTLSTTPVGAQTKPATSYAFTVNTTLDTHDAHPGDGICADSKSHCSLRAAIEESDALPSGSHITITIPAGTYGLTLGTLKLTGKHTITITGAGRTSTIIRGNHTFRIMRVAFYTSAFLSQLTLSGGTGFLGGGIYNLGSLSVSKSTLSDNTTTKGSGGGINNSGTLSVTASTLSNNSAPGGDCGGIDNGSGRLTVTNSTFSGNSARLSGGGINNYSAATVSDSTFSGNSAQAGGGGINNGIYGNGGTLTVSTSTFSGNSSGNSGGGIDNSYGTATVSTSTFSGNSSGNSGGGINNWGTLMVSSSTLSGNKGGGGGGGISNGFFGNGGTLMVSESTLSGNSAGSGGGIYNDASSSVTLTGTIVANSKAGSNCTGPITDKGYNLDSGTSCSFRLKTDLTKTNPKLGPLRDNGGPTQTMALLKGSKAIDWVNHLKDCPSTDQRGYQRPDDSEHACDIGAYESAY